MNRFRGLVANLSQSSFLLITSTLMTSTLITLSLFTSSPKALPVEFDAGFRGVISEEKYDMGLSGELGAIAPVDSKWEVGLHLNYTHFRPHSETGGTADEWGGYVTAYYLPTIDQPFSLRLGPHIGTNYMSDDFSRGLSLDFGGDAMVFVPIKNNFKVYVCFAPSFIIGSYTTSIYRIGFGVEYHR